MKKGKFIIHIILYSILGLVAVVTLIPIVYSIFSSFKENMEILNNGSQLLPKQFRWENYSQAWKLADFATYTKNTVFMSGTSTIGTVFFSTMSGYVYARSTFKGKNILFGLIIATMFITTGSIGLYPQLQIAKFLHINRSIFGVSIIHMLSANAMNVYLVKNFISGIPKELDEAAAIDGCDFFRTFIYIIMPLLVPIMATVGILTFVGTWNDYLLPLIFTMGNPSQYPITVGLVSLQSLGETATSWNLLLAGTTISIIPILVIFLVFNKYFAKGLTEGAVKG